MKISMPCLCLFWSLGFLRPVLGVTVIADSVTIARPFLVDEGVRVVDGDTRTVVSIVDGGVVAAGMEPHDSSVINVDGGRVNAVHAFASSIVNITEGEIPFSVVASDSAVVNVYGGSIGVGQPEDFGYSMYGDKRMPTVLSAAGDSNVPDPAAGNSIVNIFGGVLGHGFSAYRGGTINLYGGSFEIGFVVGPESTINIFGRGLFLMPIEMTDTYTENLVTGSLLDGTPLRHLAVAQTSQKGVAGQIVLHNIPEPTSVILLGVGVLTIFMCSFRTKV